MNENAQMSDFREGAVKMMAGQIGGRLGDSVQQSEVQRQMTKLLDTAEALDATASKLIACVDKVTRPEPPMPTGPVNDQKLAACPSTILGRDLDSINNRIRNTMASLQSTIQRIEL